ncbi:Substance-K receptor [Holothuria leucospilota]|uniref:Substance-K receptor n=1 Tax=Holothuria leucospilota TaxID=206669 RepID=A0A9Q1H1M6_HOLLE|nr:Substance-K receptor [Holothuria leucospilota]
MDPLWQHFETSTVEFLVWDEHELKPSPDNFTPSFPEETEETGVFFTKTFVYNVVLVVVNLLALSLNGFVVFLVARFRELRNTVTLCFVNLAITDISLVLFSMSGSLRRTTGIDLTVITGCVAPVYLHAASIFCTGATMAFLAFDRYRMITSPLKTLKERTNRKLLLSLLAIWILSFAVYAFLPIITVDLGPYCIIAYKNLDKLTGDRLYHTFKAILNYFLPLTVTSYLYLGIYLHLRKGALPSDSKSSVTVNGRISKTVRERRLRGILSAMLVVVLFAVCFLPTTVMSLWRAWDINFPDEDYFKYHTITGLFSRINVIANPFLYTLSAPNFKAKIKMVFRCCCWVGDTENSSAIIDSRKGDSSGRTSETDPSKNRAWT